MSLILVSIAEEPIELLRSIQGFKSSAFFDEQLFKACRSTGLQTFNLPEEFCTHNSILSSVNGKALLVLKAYNWRKGWVPKVTVSILPFFMAPQKYKMRSYFRKTLDNMPLPELSGTSLTSCLNESHWKKNQTQSQETWSWSWLCNLPPVSSGTLHFPFPVAKLDP